MHCKGAVRGGGTAQHGEDVENKQYHGRGPWLHTCSKSAPPVAKQLLVRGLHPTLAGLGTIVRVEWVDGWHNSG